jgi:hypothetical protein
LIQITFKFDSVDEAQTFLDEVQGRQRPQADATADPVPEKKERKARSDAGQPRGPYKRKESDSPLPSEAAAPATQTPAETPPAAPVAAATAAPATAALTIADVRAAMTGRPTDKNIKLLNKFGYMKSSELPQEKFADFIAACKRGE